MSDNVKALTSEQAHLLAQLPRRDCVTSDPGSYAELRMIPELRKRGLITVTLDWDAGTKHYCPRLIMLTPAGGEALAAYRAARPR